MKGFLFSVVLAFFFNHTLSAQHSMAVFYAPSISKTNFLEKENPYDIIRFYQAITDAPRAFWGRSFGFFYQYQRGKSIFNLTAKDNIRGQRSRFYDTPHGPQVNRFGSYHEVAYWTNTVSLGYGRVFLKRPSASFGIMGHIGLDIIRNIIFHAASLSSYSGTIGNHSISVGSDFKVYDGYYWYDVRDGLNLRNYRMESCFGLFSEIMLSEHIAVILKPQLYYCSSKFDKKGLHYDGYDHPGYFAADLQAGLLFKIFGKKSKK
ncbi:MAG: hypothetical protein RIR11_2337 [Bacteroidota bacterium]